MTHLTDRLEYGRYFLDINDLQAEPIDQLRSWWQEAQALKISNLDAVYLGTVDELGRPDGRIVLLKDYDERGLVFFTNYESQKSAQLQKKPYACMTLFWPKMERQIRVRGQVQLCTREESLNYFATRPRGAQLGAWASRQSTPIGSREELEQAYEKIDQQFLGQEIPCPEFWGGYRLGPTYFEFWQGRPNRLHDRFCYRLEENASWTIERLSP